MVSFIYADLLLTLLRDFPYLTEDIDLILLHVPNMRPDFTSCGSNFLNYSLTIYSNLVYHGPVHEVYANTGGPTLITLQGCKDLCGSGVDYYSWKDASNTITTWVGSTFEGLPRAVVD